MLVVLRVKKNFPHIYGGFSFILGQPMYAMRNVLSILILLLHCHLIHAQTLGGSSVYNFLKLSPSPQLSAVGGVNVSLISKDLALAWTNPALLRPEAHKNITANFTSLFAGISSGHALVGWHHEPSAITFGAGVQFMSYGETTQTDASGNISGLFKPYDYAVQLSAARRYLEHWHYGATIKVIQSSYGQFRSGGAALDIGLTFKDSSRGVQVGFLARNMGTQWRNYGTMGEDLPFDLQLGISRRIPRSPFQLSVTAHRLHQFDLIYNDTLFNAANGVTRNPDKWLNNLFRHFVFALQILPSDRLEFSIGYNVLRRAELGQINLTNGLTGISFGVGVQLKKMQIRFSRSHYQSTTGFSQFGLNLEL